MSLMRVAQEFEQLGPGEQAAFAETVKRLLGEGLLWREDEDDRKAYNFLARRFDLVRDYLHVSGWRLEFYEPARIYYVTHVDGAHRRRLNKELSVWLLIVRLLYAEKRERPEATLTRSPVVRIGDIADRYASFFPNQHLRKKTSLTDALRAMQGMKLIGAVDKGGLRADDPDKPVELRPALEVVLPAAEITSLAERLRKYQQSPDDADVSESDIDPLSDQASR
jgi:Domain of unknown function (DUF4194)